MATRRPNKKLATRPMYPYIAEGVLRGWLAPKLAADAELDLKPVIAALGVPKKGVEFKIDADKFQGALDAALKPKDPAKPTLAADADVADVREVLEQLKDAAPQVADLLVGGPEAAGAEVPPGGSEVPPGNPDAGIVDPKDTASPDDVPVDGGKSDDDTPPADPADPADPDDGGGDTMAQVMEFLSGKLSPEDLQALQAIVEGGGVTSDKQPVPKGAMDAAIAASEKRMRDNFKAVRAAEQAVLPFVGQIKTAMDSANEVYKFALTKLGVKVDGVHPSAFPAILAAQPLAGAKPARRPAMDAAAVDGSLKTRFGDLATRLKA